MIKFFPVSCVNNHTSSTTDTLIAMTMTINARRIALLNCSIISAKNRRPLFLKNLETPVILGLKIYRWKRNPTTIIATATTISCQLGSLICGNNERNESNIKSPTVTRMRKNHSTTAHFSQIILLNTLRKNTFNVHLSLKVF